VQHVGQQVGLLFAAGVGVREEAAHHAAQDDPGRGHGQVRTQQALLAHQLQVVLVAAEFALRDR
jgi:hypothetical protein